VSADVPGGTALVRLEIHVGVEMPRGVWRVPAFQRGAEWLRRGRGPARAGGEAHVSIPLTDFRHPQKFNHTV